MCNLAILGLSRPSVYEVTFFLNGSNHLWKSRPKKIEKPSHEKKTPKISNLGDWLLPVIFCFSFSFKVAPLILFLVNTQSLQEAASCFYTQISTPTSTGKKLL